MILIDRATCFLTILSMLTLISEMCCFISTAQFFYGSQVHPVVLHSMENAVRRVWRVPWITHWVLLPHLAGCMDIKLGFSRRCIRFLNMAMKSDNVVVRTIINMGIEAFHFVMGRT